MIAEQVFVAPGHEHRGIGHRLLAHAEGYAIAKRARALCIVVEPDNWRARGLLQPAWLRPGPDRIWSSWFCRAWYEHAVSLKYELLTHSPSGRERVQQYASEEPLTPGEVLQLARPFLAGGKH